MQLILVSADAEPRRGPQRSAGSSAAVRQSPATKTRTMKSNNGRETVGEDRIGTDNNLGVLAYYGMNT